MNKLKSFHDNTGPGRFHPLALLVLVLIIYGQTISFGFISDDLFYLNENHLIRHPANAWKLIDVPQDGLMGEMAAGFMKSRNLRDLSYAVDYWLWGEKPAGFHLSNILLHVFAGLLLYRFGRLYLLRQAALLATALFLLHPVNTEVVAYVSGRKESLMSIAVLVSLLTLEKSRQPGRAWWLPFSLAAYVVAFYVKEAAIVLAGLVVFKDVLLPRFTKGSGVAVRFSRRRVVEWSLFCVVGLTLLWVRYGGSAVELTMSLVRYGGSDAGGAAMQYPGMSPLFLIPFYALLFLFPVNLQFEYRGGFPEYWDWLINSAALQSLVLVLLVAALALLMRRNPTGGYWVLWFFVALAPVLHFIPFHTPAAEHYLYLPGMGLCLFAGALITQRNWSTSPIKQSVILIFLVVITIFSNVRVQDYQNDYLLYKDAYNKSPQNMIAYYGKSHGGIRSGDIGVAEGIAVFERFRQQMPKTASFYFTLAHLYEKTGHLNKARNYYQSAIKYGKRPWEVYVALARLEVNVGALQQAEETLLHLNDNYAYHPEAYLLLGTLRMMADDATTALGYYERSSTIDVHSEMADIGIDFALWRLGRMTSSEFVGLHPEITRGKIIENDALVEGVLMYLLKRPEHPGALEVL